MTIPSGNIVGAPKSSSGATGVTALTSSDGSVILSGSTGAVNESVALPMNMLYFGDGLDGNVTVSSPITIQRDMYYQNLTISAGAAINMNTYRIYVSGILDISAAPAGAIFRNGPAGGTAASATGGSAATVASNTFHSVPNPAGATAGANGTTTNGANASSPGNNAVLYASSSARGGGAGTGSGGTAGTGSTSNFPSNNAPPFRFNDDFSSPIPFNSGQPGGGGGGGGGDVTNAGGGGGGGGACGGFIWISAYIIARGTNTTPGIIQALGGAGGNGFSPVTGNCGGGGAGAGGGGGAVIIYYYQLTGSTITGAIDVTGGNGGTGGTKVGTGVNGNGGGAGPAGYAQTHCLVLGSLPVVSAANPAIAPQTGGVVTAQTATQTRIDL